MTSEHLIYLKYQTYHNYSRYHRNPAGEGWIHWLRYLQSYFITIIFLKEKKYREIGKFDPKLLFKKGENKNIIPKLSFVRQYSWFNVAPFPPNTSTISRYIVFG